MGSHIEKRVWAMGLMDECPFGTALTNCPLREIRSLPFEERVEIFKKMPDEEIDEIIAYHKQCQENREA